MSRRDDEHPWAGYDSRTLARLAEQLKARNIIQRDIMHTERWKKIRACARKREWHLRLGAECLFDATLWSSVGITVAITARPKNTGFIRIDR